jgi:branched-chain amino acid transport system ATP-binding protein
MLELRGVRVSYGAAEVVRGVHLELGPGEVVGLIGPNRAGKSSTLRAIFGAAGARAEGSIRFRGEELIGRAPEEIAARGLALVPEGGQVFASLTVAENLALAAGKTRSMVEATVERFPALRERAAQRAERLSGGERQQLAIARALASKPRVLALDAPSLGLAPRAIDSIYELLGRLREDGMTMLLAEQNAARTIEFCDRCLVLGKGRVRLHGDREDLRRENGLVHAYLGGEP